MKTAHEIARNNPVARFYYQGTHSHPVRRTVLVIESTPNLLTGYELREGSTVRSYKDAPVKSYRKDRIACESQLGARKHRLAGPQVTSLRRESLASLVVNGA